VKLFNVAESAVNVAEEKREFQTMRTVKFYRLSPIACLFDWTSFRFFPCLSFFFYVMKISPILIPIGRCERETVLFFIHDRITVADRRMARRMLNWFKALCSHHVCDTHRTYAMKGWTLIVVIGSLSRYRHRRKICNLISNHRPLHSPIIVFDCVKHPVIRCTRIEFHRLS